MKTGLRLITRKTQLHIPQLLGLLLLLTVGVCFFVTLFTITARYEETAEQYLTDCSYADFTIYGEFDNESVTLLSECQGVVSAKGRTVHDFREGDVIFRAVSLTDGINIPYLYEGRLPENKSECILLNRNAKAMGLGIGDTVTLEGGELVITGLAASPEYIYMVQNERTAMARTDSFAVLYVTEDFYPSAFNEITAITESGFSADESAVKIKAFQVTELSEQQNYILYRQDLGQIGSFAYIFPFVFAVLIAVVIYVMLSRTIKKDKKQIGVMKALGTADGKIIGIYLSQFCFTALIGGLFGCLTAALVTDGIIDIMSAMFEVPTLTFAVKPFLWSGAVLICVILCAVSGVIALLPLLSLSPANAMRPRIPKGGRRLFIERVGFLWGRLSFNTRYALKNSLRNKGRFLAVVLGMCGSGALLAFSLGFKDSIGDTHDKYFQEFANYDVIINFKPLPLMIEHPSITKTDESYKALVVPVEISGEDYMLTVTEQGFDMVNIPSEKLPEGVIIPEYFAEKWDIGVGDTLKINDVSVTVSAVSPQYLGLTIYTDYDYINSVTDEIPPAYNAVYARSGDMETLSAFLKDNGFTYATLDDDATSFDSIMDSTSVLIGLMIACSLVLGFTVLYSVGLINLSAREYEYMFMGVMGYPHKSIMAAHLKETALQLVLAVPLGFLLGNVLLESIKGEFSGDSFVIQSAINPLSYLISAVAVIGVTAVMAAVTSRYIDGIDITEGLKAQDE